MRLAGRLDLFSDYVEAKKTIWPKLGMGQNLLLPYLEESRSINQLFEVPSGCQGFDFDDFDPNSRWQNP